MNSLPPGPAALSDWLSLVDEQPMEPHLPIIDPHHHLWEGRSGNTSVPFVNTFGARNAMGQYLLEELCADDIESLCYCGVMSQRKTLITNCIWV
jgi:hypothetical protein